MKILHRKNKERKQIKKYKTASITAEAALLYPILVLLLVFCLQKTLALYEVVRQTAEEIYTEETVDSADIFQKKVKAEQINLKKYIKYEVTRTSVGCELPSYDRGKNED